MHGTTFTREGWELGEFESTQPTDQRNGETILMRAHAQTDNETQDNLQRKHIRIGQSSLAVSRPPQIFQ